MNNANILNWRLQPRAVPLVTHDPYFSAWSFADQLHQDEVRHWTGAPYSFSGLIRIDGETYRLMGAHYSHLPVLRQESVTVWPTRTIYTFSDHGVHVRLTFLSPLLPHDLETLSRPVTYVTWDVTAMDGKAHSVEVYLHCQADWVVNSCDQTDVIGSRYRLRELDVVRLGTSEQPVLEHSGDNRRIDWGYLYLAVPRQQGNECSLADADSGRTTFIADGCVPDGDDLRWPRHANDQWPVLAASLNLGEVGANTVQRHALIGYDQVYSLEYFHRKLRPYWARNGKGAADMLADAEREYARLSETCRAYDEELVADLQQVGGDEYAQIASLAFRQCIAAHGLAADFDGSPLFFSKENFSNGCINTVDVTYPSAPFFLLFNSELLKAQLTAILDYALTPRWKFPYAPHDLGTYPKANGQVYGGGETSDKDQMPVEECGNMLILVAAYVRVSNDFAYGRKYFPLLAKWAVYLAQKGLDPDNQLCTDDFAGHLAHNVNLSLKAILALGAFSAMAVNLGFEREAWTSRQRAEEMAAQWCRLADDGDHYRLTFDQSGTWSQKYNLVWHDLLRLHLFPQEVAQREVAFYLKQQNAYGLPLDNRSDGTKADWIVWSASLADRREDFEALVHPLFCFLNESTSRVPFADWYESQSGNYRDFQARSVVGGVYIKLLSDWRLAAKWQARR
jgi:hypothetical protein